MAAALCAAVNDWTAKELLDREPRLRASILLPMHNPALAVREIERLAADRRFVQVLVPAMGDMPLGRRIYWPVYEAAEKHDLPIGIHAGSTYRHAPTGSGWPAHRVEDYVAQSAAFESQLLSFLAEGVFQKFPRLKVVLIESGFTWLPTLLWRTSKTWRGVRPEVPWIDRSPAEILRDNVRLTLQPVDAPAGDPQVLARTLEHIGSDRMLLFSTDYPHWHFDGDDVLPDGFPRGEHPRAAGRQCARHLSAFAGGGRQWAIMRREARRPCDERSGPRSQSRAAADDRRLRHPSGVSLAGGLASVPVGALARAHDDIRRASAPGTVGSACMAAHDGVGNARRCVSRRTVRPAPIST